MKFVAKLAVAGAGITVLSVTGCSVPFAHHAATPAKVTAKVAAVPACPGQGAWNITAKAAIQALYSDTGALSADAHMSNLPGIVKAGRSLAADAITAAALSPPPADVSEWRALISAYAAAGANLSAGTVHGVTVGITKLEDASAAMSAFAAATGKCVAATPLDKIYAQS
jgi:hypothetical protein